MSYTKKLSYMSAQAEDLVLEREILKLQEQLSKTILDSENYDKFKNATIKHETLDEMLAIVQHRYDFNNAMAAEEAENKDDSDVSQ